MTQLSQLLRDKAEEIRLSSPNEVAVEHLKQAGYSDVDARTMVAQHVMEKEATSALVSSGVDIEQAVAMVKAANVNLKDLVSFEPEADIHPSVDLLLKAAAHIEELEATIEAKNEVIEKVASEQNIEEVELPAPFVKAAQAGVLTQADIAELEAMNSDTLHKIASVMDEPVELGRAHGIARPKTDPFLEFLIG